MITFSNTTNHLFELHNAYNHADCEVKAAYNEMLAAQEKMRIAINKRDFIMTVAREVYKRPN